MIRRFAFFVATLLLFPHLHAQQAPPASTPSQQPPSTLPFGSVAPGLPSPLAQSTFAPGVLFLFDLERRFAASVAQGGGKAFASWFADDAVTLNNGRPAVLGRGNIAAQTTWDPAAYQLTWTPEGGQMLPSGDAGYTWGLYQGRAKDRNNQPILTSGRYLTLWKKTPDGTWKVALDASAQAPPEAGSCCTLPKP